MEPAAGDEGIRAHAVAGAITVVVALFTVAAVWSSEPSATIAGPDENPEAA